LEPIAWSRALYAPPLAGLAPYAEGFEQAGARLWPNFAGLILLEAVKQTFAVKPKGLGAPARTFVPGMLRPARTVLGAPAPESVRRRDQKRHERLGGGAQ
jgi:hypothetical protein